MRVEYHIISLFFFFNDTATTEIYTLSLHDALPILAAAVARAGAGPVRAMDRLELLQAPAGADGHARQRALREMDRHLGLVPESLVEAGQQRASPGEDDPAVHDVRRELGRRLVERRLDR